MKRERDSYEYAAAAERTGGGICKGLDQGMTTTYLPSTDAV